MKLLKLLEGLYQELRTYNENARNASAALPPVKQRKTPKDEEGEKTEFKTIYGDLMYPGYNALAIHSYTAQGRHKTHYVYANADQLKKLDRFLKEARTYNVIGKFCLKNGHLVSYEIHSSTKRGHHLQKGSEETVPVQYIGVINVDADLNEAKYPQGVGCVEGARAG